ncbi:MAG: hypothetical protein NTV39_00505 [Candidatus Saccharibacteria bacterium]|nr:hypothetical protein [Candidatus Saccharibacteria bacterium]
MDLEKIKTRAVRKIKRLKKLPVYYRAHKKRSSVIFVLTVMVLFEAVQILQPFLQQQAYAMGMAGALLPETNQSMASKLKYDSKKESFSFNNGINLPSAESTGIGSQQISATAYQDASKGLSVTDPVNKVDFSMTPKYKLLPGKQDNNRVVYPFDNGQGWAVYTMQGTGVKEDIVLKQANGDSATFDYKLGLGDGLEARMEADGSVGVYGSKLFSTNITAGSEKDADLLLKARKNAEKDTFMFSIPRPVILEKDKKISTAKATFTLQGSDLKINVTGLKKGNYPLTIDPSVYVVTAQQFMNGNNETNIDFDVANKLIKKGGTTGARFNQWDSTTNLPATEWAGSSVAAGGFLYSVGGFTAGTTTASAAVNWAKFNTSTGTVDSANPGNGACGSWCTSAAYNLPTARTNFSLVAYNGFLYAFGGMSSGTPQNTVYIAKLGANGEPRLWHPTDTNKANWVYWYQDANLSSIRSDMSAVAYNNRMYLMGGRSTSGTPVNTVQIADINPMGTLGTWTSSTALPYAGLYGQSSQVYNDRLYILGGDATVGGALSNSVYYNKINSDGTLNNWVQTTSFAGGRITNGGNMTSAWGAYIYISGGCTVVNGSGYCTTAGSDTQVASINADGSLDAWNGVGGVSNQVSGYSMVAWRGYIYEIGGCSAQNTGTGACTTMLNRIVYGTINQDGDASTVDQSVDTSTAPCSDGTPTSCNLPGTTYIGNMLSPTIIVNGYLYVIGGCTNNACSATIGNTAYVAISSTGIMSKPATCPGGTYRGNTWCVDSTNPISGGVAASSPVVFNNRIYLVGGLDGTANTNSINRADINNDGSLSAWATEQPMGSGTNNLGITSVSYSYAYARANPASAGTYPGNLYIFGGCTTSGSAGCTTGANSQAVYKCNIKTDGTIELPGANGCTTTGQQQIGTLPGATGTGLAIMSGTVYANYIYLIGGVAPGLQDLTTVRYAKFNNSNNVVAVSGGAWIESPNHMVVGRRRADAFGYNGYLYVVGGFDATAGVLADIEFIKVNVSDGSLGSATDTFHVSAVTINQRWGLSVTVSNSYAYVIGGCTTGNSPSNCTARTDVVQTFQIYNNDSGSPSTFSTSANTYGTNSPTSTEPNRLGASATILNGYMYVAGGCNSATDCTTAIDKVSYAPIDVNGALGAWTNTTAPLTAVRAWGKLEAAGGTLYYMGGQSSTSTDERGEVYYGTPASGNVTSWGTAANGLPNVRTKFGSAVWNNRLYVVGGLDTNAASTATVYVSPQLNAGGNINSAWTTTSTSFNVARSGLTVVAYANNIYLFGGYDGSNYLSDSQYSQISTADGSVGAWTYSTSMPGPLASSDGFAANGYIYLMGGRSSTNTCDPIALVTPVSANTTIASGNDPTGVGAWYETNQRYTDQRYGNSAEYYNGKAYVVGGGLCNALTSPVTDSSTGAGTFVVPTGVTSITYKAWSGGGGGGAGGSAAAGGAGGGSGFVQATMAVTPGETLNLYVGAGGGRRC